MRKTSAISNRLLYVAVVTFWVYLLLHILYHHKRTSTSLTLASGRRLSESMSKYRNALTLRVFQTLKYGNDRSESALTRQVGNAILAIR